MSYIDLDAKLAALTETKDEEIVVHLDGEDHTVRRPGAIDYMKMAAAYQAVQKGATTPEQLWMLADLLPRMIPGAADYLSALPKEAFELVLEAVFEAMEDPTASPGTRQGEESTASVEASPVPSDSSAGPTA